MTELENYLTLARRAKSTGNYTTALKYYEMIQLKNPNDWESYLYCITLKSYNIIVAQILPSAQAVIRSYPALLSLIKKSSDSAAACIEVVNEISNLEKTLRDAYMNYLSKRIDAISRSASEYGEYAQNAVTMQAFQTYGKGIEKAKNDMNSIFPESKDGFILLTNMLISLGDDIRINLDVNDANIQMAKVCYQRAKNQFDELNRLNIPLDFSEYQTILTQRIEDCDKQIFNLLPNSEKYNKAKSLMNGDAEDCEEALDIFDSISGYKDSDELRKICYDKAVELAEEELEYEKERLYDNIKELIKNGTRHDYECAIESLKMIPDYKNSNEMLATCYKNLSDFKKQDVEKELLEVNEKIKKAKKGIIRGIGIIAFCVILGGEFYKIDRTYGGIVLICLSIVGLILGGLFFGYLNYVSMSNRKKEAEKLKSELANLEKNLK